MLFLCSASAFAQDVNTNKETSTRTESFYDDGVRKVSDVDLLKKDNLYKNVRRLKTWGWIGGGFLVAGGIVLLARFSSNTFGQVEPGIVAAGAGCISLGAGLTTFCLVKAHKQKKKIDAKLQTSAIYRYDIPFSNGSSLSVGADMFHDRIMNKRTVGLGLTYNF